MIGGFEYDDSVTTQRSVLSILKLLRPANVVGHRMVRVGRVFDGGYVMIDDFSGCGAAYSLGISNDVSWDRQMADYGLDIYQYDHTIDELPEQHARFKWHKTGIAAETDVGARLETLPNLVVANGHADLDLILKCDIEGSEYGMFTSTPSKVLNRFRQIVVEMHQFERLTDLNYAKTVYEALCNLSVTHRVVHVHANNHCGYAILGATPVPSVLEFTFARKESYEFSTCVTTFPTELDAPCYPYRADYSLGNFAF